MNFKTLIDKIIENGKLILAQPTFMFKSRDIPFKEYRVEKDDMGRLDLIAEDQYGDAKQIEYILKFNGISDPFSIQEGDILKIPNEGQPISKLKRPKTAVENIVRQSFVDGKRLSKKDKRRVDFLKKKYNIEEVLPPNMLKTGFSNSEIDSSGEVAITKIGMGVSTPNSTFVSSKVNKAAKEVKAGSTVDDIVNKAINEMSDAEIKEIEKIQKGNIKDIVKEEVKMATTFDGKEIGSDNRNTSTVSTSSSDLVDSNGNKIGSQSVNESEQIEGDKITKTVTKTIVKPDGSSETTQTVTFSKYKGK